MRSDAVYAGGQGGVEPPTFRSSDARSPGTRIERAHEIRSRLRGAGSLGERRRHWRGPVTRSVTKTQRLTPRRSKGQAAASSRFDRQVTRYLLGSYRTTHR